MKGIREARAKTEAHGTKDANTDHSKRWSYFPVCFGAYTISLITTIVFMVVFHAAQPALLYIVPACTGSVTLLALIHGEFKDLIAYSEEEENENEEDDGKEGKPPQKDSKKD
jgi:minor histocompatibility antigen H13